MSRADAARTRDQRERRCTATARSTGQRCGMYPARGSSVCKFHGSSTPQSRRAIAWRTEVAEALLDGRPHPAVVFFEMLKMRWYVSDDGSELVCALPVDQLGGPDAAASGLGWVHLWHQVMKYSKLADRAYVEKRRGVRRRPSERDERPSGGP